MRCALILFLAACTLSLISCTKKVHDPLSDFQPPFSDLQIPKGGLSPNGQYVVALRAAEFTYSGLSASGHNPETYFLSRSDPGNIIPLPAVMIDCNEAKPGNLDGNIRWSKDSSAVLVFCYHYSSAPSGPAAGPNSIYVVPTINGHAGAVTDMLVEILKAADSNFVNTHIHEIGSPEEARSNAWGKIFDGNFPDNLTFNEANQIVIDCDCMNSVPGDRSFKGWSMHISGLWDPIAAKFVKVTRSPIDHPK